MMTGELQLFVDYCHLVTSNHVTHAHMTKSRSTAAILQITVQWRHHHIVDTDFIKPIIIKANTVKSNVHLMMCEFLVVCPTKDHPDSWVRRPLQL